MDNLAREVFQESNNVRTNPTSFIPYLQEMLSQFKGSVLYKKGEIPLSTNEGPSAVKECIQYLQNQNPVSALTWDDNMSKAAADHANDIGPKGITGHTGSDGSSMRARLERHGDWMGKIGENIDFGAKNGRDVIISLIVDDGVASRGHRTNLFSPDFKKVGVACSNHKQYQVCTVLDYASEYSKKGENQGRNQFQGFQNQNAGFPFSFDQGQPSSNFHPSNLSNQNNFHQSNLSNQNNFHSSLNENADEDKPPNTVSISTSKSISIVNGHKTIKETKTYTLADGSQKITEKTYYE